MVSQGCHLEAWKSFWILCFRKVSKLSLIHIFIERIIPEDVPVSEDTFEEVASYIDNCMQGFIEEYKEKTVEDIVQGRYDRFRRI